MSESDAHLRASEVAEVLSDLTRDTHAFPTQAAEDLYRLLANDLAESSPGERRDARLGLMIDLVVGGGQATGEWVTVADYEAARSERAQRGEDWPSSSALADAYGGWLVALRAAMRFYMRGGPARVAADHRHAHPSMAYAPREIINGLILFRQELGCWPSEWEWGKYRSVRVRSARRAGGDLRLPGPKQIRKAYGSFDRALRTAREVFDRAVREKP